MSDLSVAPHVPSADLPENAVEVRELTKIYPSKGGKPAVAALQGVNLTIPRGSFFGLLGPNGAGKSTLINILAGLVNRTGGAVRIWDFDIDREMRAARRSIGIVPQELNIDPFFTPREGLEIQAGLFGVPREERRTDDILKALGLADKADAYMRSLSGGMRRRLLIAKAMVHSPPILVLDEPTAGVDVELRQQLWAYVRELNRNGTTVLLTTHYLTEAEQLCDRIAIIDQGRVIACEAKTDLLRRLDTKHMTVTLADDLPAIPQQLAAYRVELRDNRHLVFEYAPSKTHSGQILTAVQQCGLSITDLSTRETELENEMSIVAPDRPGPSIGMTLTRWFALLPPLLAFIWFAACAPHVALPGPAVTTPAVNSDSVMTLDGEELPLRRWLPDQAKPHAIVLALHGFNDYGHFIDDAATTWARSGIAVYAPDQRGFGETKSRGLWPGVDALADDVRTIVALLRERHPGVPLYLLGESMGAAVAVVAFASPDPPAADGVILSAPAVWTRTAMPGYQRAALFFAAHTVPWLRLTGQGLRIMASDNIEALRKLSRDPMVIKGTRVDAIWGMADLMDRAYEAAADLRSPALILYGAKDQVIPPEQVRDFIANLPADAHEHQRFAFYPSGYHLLMRDLGADQVIADIFAWIKAPTLALPSGADREARDRVADAPRPRPTG